MKLIIAVSVVFSMAAIGIAYYQYRARRAAECRYEISYVNSTIEYQRRTCARLNYPTGCMEATEKWIEAQIPNLREMGCLSND